MSLYGSPEQLDFLKFTKAKEPLHCSRCGAIVTSKFCPECGTAVNKKQLKQPYSAEQKAALNKFYRIYFLVFAVFGVVLSLLVAHTQVPFTIHDFFLCFLCVSLFLAVVGLISSILSIAFKRPKNTSVNVLIVSCIAAAGNLLLLFISFCLKI